ncbi:hypothetical protein QL285_047629 [Trifolium repens]|nr:hypothetical protein QL285_047629 [Trifolium repens]
MRLETEDFTVGHAVLKAASTKVTKHEKTYSDNQHIFIPLAFDTFGFLVPETVDLLKKVQRVMHSNIMSLRSLNVVFERLILSSKKVWRCSLLSTYHSSICNHIII